MVSLSVLPSNFLLIFSISGFNKGYFSQRPLTNDRYNIYYASFLELPKTKNVNFKFFFGPNEDEVLAAYDNEMEDIINLGWGIFRWVNELMIQPIFDLLKSTGWSFGLIIFILSRII